MINWSFLQACTFNRYGDADSKILLGNRKTTKGAQLRTYERVHILPYNWPRGVTVSTLDSESSGRGPNLREASLRSLRFLPRTTQWGSLTTFSGKGDVTRESKNAKPLSFRIITGSYAKPTK